MLSTMLPSSARPSLSATTSLPTMATTSLLSRGSIRSWRRRNSLTLRPRGWRLSPQPPPHLLSQFTQRPTNRLPFHCHLPCLLSRTTASLFPSCPTFCIQLRRHPECQPLSTAPSLPSSLTSWKSLSRPRRQLDKARRRGLESRKHRRRSLISIPALPPLRRNDLLDRRRLCPKKTLAGFSGRAVRPTSSFTTYL